MYHLDKMLGPHSDEVTWWRNRANLAKRDTSSSRDVGMLAPRHGMFKVGTTEYFASYKGEEIKVSPTDVEAMKAHGFHDAPGQPPKRMPSDSDLMRKGLSAQFARHPHAEKRAPHQIGGASRHPRTTFGVVTVETHGAVFIEIDEGTDQLSIHNETVHLSEIARDLRLALVSAAAGFNAAFLAEEESAQVAIVGLIVSEVLRRDKKLSERVKASVDRSQNA